MLVLAVVALGIPLGAALADRVDAEVRSEARGQADVVAASSADLLDRRSAPELQGLATTAARSVRGRVLVVNANGSVLADSAGTPRGRDYGTRPEIRAALAGRADQRERTSQTLGEKLLATAVPVIRGGRPAGAVRVTQSMAAVQRAVRRAWLGLGLIGALVVGLGLGAGYLIARGVARPTLRLDEAARRVAQGDLSARATVEGGAEQRSLARTFNDMTERLGRLLASQREFVADASHQLRTPLAGLRLRLEEAQAESDQPAVRDELEAALRETDRLAQMVGELLELSRAGEKERPGERVVLAAAAERASRRWERTARERGLHLAVEAPDDGSTVLVAPADLDRIVDALVENALVYSPRDTTVTIRAGAGTITIADEGPGLQPGEEEVVFDRFHRGHAGRRGGPGTGLGLPIARELARPWRAAVGLRNRPGGGAVAEVRFAEPLPAAAPALEEPAVRSPS